MTLSMTLFTILGAGVLVGLFFIHRSLSKLRAEISKSIKPISPPDPVASTSSISRQTVHDLNNLLGTIAGFTDAVLEDLPRSSPLREDLKEVLEASERAKRLLKQLQKSDTDTAVKKPGSTDISKQTHSYPPLSQNPPAFNRTSSYPPVAKPVPAYEKPKSMPPAAHGTEASSPKSRTQGESLIQNEISLSKKASRPQQTKLGTSGGEHLLIVDDELQLLTMFRRVFEPQGYQVTTFSNGLIAWDDFQKHADMYDLAILDQRMPEMSGTSLAIEMLNCRPDFPIILLSGFSDTISPDDAARIGIRRFLSKPIPQAELTATIRKTLDEPTISDS